MSSHLPLGTISRICRKSPPRTTVFPPKIFSVACASSNCIKSHRVRLVVSKVQRCIIGVSSQMIKLALRTNSATFIYCVMLQVDSSCKLIGILNFEWVVLPPRNNKDAILDEAIASTILPCLHRRDRSVVQTNVLSVPPPPYTKNNLPFLFVTTFKIVSYAFCTNHHGAYLLHCLHLWSMNVDHKPALLGLIGFLHEQEGCN